MYKLLTALLLIIFLTSCASLKPKNSWQYNASSSIKKYKLHFLQGKDLRAASELSHARNSAKSSANLETLINIELTVCAMNIIDFKNNKCDTAKNLLHIQPNKIQLAYLHLLEHNIQKNEIVLLPKTYKDYAKSNLTNDNNKKVNEAISNIKVLSSKLIASSLSKDIINNENIEKLIIELSFNGYKRPLIKWLNIQLQREKNSEKQNILKEKIKILTSN